MDTDKKVKITATVTGAKGSCKVGHKIGDSFEISCHNTGSLCGFFYYSIFPSLSTYQYGGKYPWWNNETFEFSCPDPVNQITLRLEKQKID